MENNKGFTLVEVLVTVVIIALLGGIGVISYQTFFKTSEERYFDAIESDVLLAGNDYFTDHRDELPVGNELSEVSLNDLIRDKYIEKVTDSRGNSCSTGKVYAYRENNKYVYEVCLECGGFKSKGKYCDNTNPTNAIIMSAVTETSGKNYVLTSYNSAAYSEENVLVTLRMDNDKVSKYVVFDTKNNASKNCPVSDGKCVYKVEKSGTYKVAAYDNDGNVIATNQYFSVKIAIAGPKFTLKGETKYLITKSDCSSNKKTVNVSFEIVKDNINEEYETIKYKLDNGGYTSINGLNVNLGSLGSGHYVLTVEVSDFAGNVSVRTASFDIVYIIDYSFDDDNSQGTHEVVKGQPYNYLSALPATKLSYGKNLDVRWYLGNTQIYPNETLVTNDCTFSIIGKMSIPVQVEDFTKYCNTSLTYTGAEQTLTTNIPANVTFVGNKGTNAGEYTITAHIDSPQYIWQNGDNFDFGDKTFKCSIAKAASNITCKSVAYTGSSQSLVNTSTGCASFSNNTRVAVGSQTVTCNGDANHTNSTCTGTINKVAATCPTTTAYSGTWDNTAHSITVSGGSGGTIQYSTDNSTWSTTKPTRTAAGTTTVYVRVAGDSNHNTVNCTSRNITINKATSSISCKTVNYSGSEIDLVQSSSYCSSLSGNKKTAAGSYTVTCNGDSNHSNSTCTGTINKVAATCPTTTAYSGTWDNKAHSISISGGSGGTIQYSTDNTNWSTTNPSRTAAGSQTTYVRVVGDSNHNTVNCTSRAITINKVAATCPTTTAYSGTWDNKAHTISVSGGSGGTIKYSTDNTNWSTTNPSRTAAGTTTVYVKVVGDSNHNDVTCTTRSVTISTAASSITCKTVNYSGSEIDLVQSSSNCASFSNNKKTAAGSYTVTCNGDSNHSNSTCTGTINKVAATCPTTTAYSGTWDNKAHSITVSGGSGGTIQYSTDNSTWGTTNPSRTAAGTTTVYVKVVGDLNHNNVSCGSRSIAISKVAATCPTTTAYSGTWDNKAHTISVSGGSGGTIQYSKDNSTWSTTNPSRTAAGSITVYVKVVGDSNHNDVTCTTRSVTISKAASSISCKTVNYSGSEIDLVQSSSYCSSFSGNKKTAAGSYTVTCNGDSNHSNSTCTGTINKVASSITCKGAQTYTGGAITSYSASSGCGSYTNGSPTDVGTYTVTCNGDSNHNSSSCSGFKICNVVYNGKCYKYVGVSPGGYRKNNWDCFQTNNQGKPINTEHCSSPYGTGAVAIGGEFERNGKVNGETQAIWHCLCYKEI